MEKVNEEIYKDLRKEGNWSPQTISWYLLGAQVVWVSLQIQCMSVKVRLMIDLSSIYIKERVTSEKILARVLASSLAVGSASHHKS